MQCTLISDLHGFKPKLDGGDLLIIAGDLTARDSVEEHEDFCEWLEVQPYDQRVVIAGNHDGNIQKDLINSCINNTYLEDNALHYGGYLIWGSPWTPTFLNWHYMKDRGEAIKERWNLIPEDVDILITHGPAYGILDYIETNKKNDIYEHVGCEELRKKFDDGDVKPKLHVFGHIHEGYGSVVFDGIRYVNASIMDANYKPIRRPINVKLKDKR